MGEVTATPWRRRGLAAAVVLAASPLLAACGGSHSGSGGSPSPGGATSASAVAYSACIRQHGVPDYPDPNGSGQLAKTDAQQLGVSNSRYQAAEHVCKHLLPTGGTRPQQEHQCMQDGDCSAAMVQQMLTADRKLARCMRGHGVPNFPDPTTDSHGPIFNISKVGISDPASHSHQFIHELGVCEQLIGNKPVPAPESFE